MGKQKIGSETLKTGGHRRFGADFSFTVIVTPVFKKFVPPSRCSTELHPKTGRFSPKLLEFFVSRFDFFRFSLVSIGIS